MAAKFEIFPLCRLSKDGKPIFHFMGCSTFAEYAVIAEISAAKIHPGADLNKVP